MASLIKIFANETLTRVLTFFFLNPATELFQRTIARQVGKALIQVQRSLKTLEDVGLITVRKEGRMVFYKAHVTHPAFQDLKNIFIKTVALGDILRKELEPHGKEIQFAWIYGSVAKGHENQDSDIDLLIISDLSLKDLSKVTSPLMEKLSRELNPLFLTPKSLLKRIQEKDPFISSLIKQPKIWMIGNDDDFRRFTGSTPP